MSQDVHRTRVLLVDDDLAFAQMMREQLIYEGFDVAAFTTASAAVQPLTKESFDILVTDLVLAPSQSAGGSGLDLIQRVRRHHPALPVVVLTGFSSQSKYELLGANVPVVEKSVGVIDVLTGVIADSIRTSSKAARLSEPAIPDALRLADIRRIFVEEMERVLKIKETTVVVPGHGQFELPKAIQGFKRDIEKRLIRFPFHQNVFLMMKFRDTNRDVGAFICDTLQSHGLRGVRADAPEWNITKSVYNPIAVLHCCKYGIALFDKGESRQAFSANVAYELGMLHQQNKECLILKHSSLPPMPFDLIKDLYVPYDADLKLRGIISRWIDGISFDAVDVASRHSDGVSK